MADKKISALTAASLPLAGSEVLPVVQSSTTKKVSVDDLTVKNIRSNATTGLLQVAGPSAGSTRVATTPDANFTVARTDAAQSFTGDQTLATGNLVVGTAGKGIDFSANTNAPGMTSELLNWYEEGTFTPTFTGLTVGDGAVFGFYRRIGKQVFITYGFICGSTTAVGNLTGVSGFPFVTGTVGGGRFFSANGIIFESGVGAYPAYALIFSASTSGFGPVVTNTNAGVNATTPFTWKVDDSLSLTATYFVD